ncbi:cell division protein FtsQ/DivIB [Thalassotalea sp. PLHSN55]|uniref:cell division protein FtsQ/DivIB n=1 Tax=Thalassotalea sp. PLHSN55 TaxID=3435888 RepID=UPI003F86459D
MATVAKGNQQEKVHWSFWLGVAFFVAVIIAILSTCWVVTQRMASEEAVPVNSIVIRGEMPYTSKADIDQIMQSINLGNFFHVDVNEVQQKVAKLPWVYSVSVRKQWPDEVQLYIVDQTPVARWNGDFFINSQGQAFQADVSRVNHALPAFFGPEGSEITALDNFKSLNKLLAFKALSIDELVLSERYSWQLILSDGVTLNLGREERVERIQRFMDVYSQIKENKKENQQVDYVDLRYDTGLAVGWKPVVEKQRV